jgi:predicted MFS family arabinose efflux permease
VHRRPYGHQLLALLTALALATLVAGWITTLPALAVVLAVAGLAVAPTYVVAYLAADLSSVPDMRTEATTWIATASNLGGAAGAAVARYLIDRTSAATALSGAGTALALAVLVLAGLHVLHPAPITSGG